jgi:hypothetical protein
VGGCENGHVGGRGDLLPPIDLQIDFPVDAPYDAPAEGPPVDAFFDAPAERPPIDAGDLLMSIDHGGVDAGPDLLTVDMADPSPDLLTVDMADPAPISIAGQDIYLCGLDPQTLAPVPDFAKRLATSQVEGESYYVTVLPQTISLDAGVMDCVRLCHSAARPPNNPCGQKCINNELAPLGGTLLLTLDKIIVPNSILIWNLSNVAELSAGMSAGPNSSYDIGMTVFVRSAMMCCYYHLNTTECR